MAKTVVRAKQSPRPRVGDAVAKVAKVFVSRRECVPCEKRRRALNRIPLPW